MSRFLLDTHIWFWYLTGSQRLPRGIREQIQDSSGNLWLSPISIWELATLTRKGKIELHGTFRAWLDEAMGHFPLRDAPISREVALRTGEVNLPHQDPGDRFLAATALVYDLTLMTVDRRLQTAPWLSTFSG